MEETKEVDLQRLLLVLLRKIWVIILLAAIVASAVYAYSKNFVTPLYSAKVSFYVNNTNINYVTGQISGISSSDLATSQRLVTTYINILKSDTVLTKVAQELGVDIPPADLRMMITAGALEETEVFAVAVSNADPKLAMDIANAIATAAPTEIANIVAGSSTKVVDWAVMPTKPYSPNHARSTIAGALIGMAIAVIAIIVQDLQDVRVKGEEDLLKISTAPVLGNIPHFSLDDRDDYYGGNSADERKDEAVNQ